VACGTRGRNKCTIAIQRNSLTSDRHWRPPIIIYYDCRVSTAAGGVAEVVWRAADDLNDVCAFNGTRSPGTMTRHFIFVDNNFLFLSLWWCATGPISAKRLPMIDRFRNGFSLVYVYNNIDSARAHNTYNNNNNIFDVVIRTVPIVHVCITRGVAGPANSAAYYIVKRPSPPMQQQRLIGSVKFTNVPRRRQQLFNNIILYRMIRQPCSVWLTLIFSLNNMNFYKFCLSELRKYTQRPHFQIRDFFLLKLWSVKMQTSAWNENTFFFTVIIWKCWLIKIKIRPSF